MNRTLRLAVVTGLFTACLPLAAHHSTAYLDKTRTVPLKGVVVEMNWMNPHARLLLDVAGPGGRTTRWELEMASVNRLVSAGLGRYDLAPGREFTIDVWLPKEGNEHKGFARFIHLPDGRIISGLNFWDCESAAQEGCAGPWKLSPAEAN